ncbi:unnamed protein product [Pedinophyceae sp. YPF-701]|nr:unnamed protein product [Pedinophyceae sp. YPF-701]
MSCCKAATSPLADIAAGDSKTYEATQKYYGKVLETSKDLKTSACTAAGKPHRRIIESLKKVPDEIKAKFYGCGAPLPLGIQGLRVLDLGSGSGRDCYVMADLVGAQGKVTGVDMTEEQLAVARKYIDSYCKETLGYAEPNLDFVHGHIEYLDKAGIQDASQDIVISNCVVNLSPDKPRVLSEVYRVLAPGGEFYFSDVYCSRRLPEHVRKHEVLWGECIAGALYTEDFRRIAQSVGFADPRVLSAAPIEVTDPELKAVVGEAEFYSITYRLFKAPGLLEDKCEDYGQYAVYRGSVEGSESAYVLDDHHKFEKGKPMLVCGNTAAMVGENGVSWLAKHFDVVGDRTTHYGLFDCGPSPVAAAPACEPGPGGACC